MKNNIVPFKTKGLTHWNIQLKQRNLPLLDSMRDAERLLESFEHWTIDKLSDEDFEYLGYTSRYSSDIDAWSLPSSHDMDNLRKYTPAMFDLLGIVPSELDHEGIKGLPYYYFVKDALEHSDFILEYFGLSRIGLVTNRVELPYSFEESNYLQYTDEMWAWLGVDKYSLTVSDFRDLPDWWEVEDAMRH